jgi:hypothetical protein
MIASAPARHKAERCSRRDPCHPSRALDKRAHVRYLRAVQGCFATRPGARPPPVLRRLAIRRRQTGKAVGRSHSRLVDTVADGWAVAVRNRIDSGSRARPRRNPAGPARKAPHVVRGWTTDRSRAPITQRDRRRPRAAPLPEGTNASERGRRPPALLVWETSGRLGLTLTRARSGRGAGAMSAPLLSRQSSSRQSLAMWVAHCRLGRGAAVAVTAPECTS